MEISKSLIEKYNIPVPRYTSYPTANLFYGEFSQKDYVQQLKVSNKGKPDYVAIYIHIPFCSKICFYCGCNACVIKNKQLIDNYIQALKKEIKAVSSLINKKRKVSQIHFGGGTPNAIEAHYLQEIVALIEKEFEFINKPEITIECNPAQLSLKYIDDLLAAKFNRFSLGIQDFNTNVLKAVNRDPSAMPVKDIVEYIREKNTEASINLDFIYGLPGQTTESFNQSISEAIDIKPDRLVTFSYAHIPWLKKHQEILEKKGLPNAEDKMSMFLASRDLLKENNYQPIGLDHYVLPEDELSKALAENQLHRNFQGYCTRRTTGQVYAFGVSAISQLEKSFSQNVKDVEEYIQLINNHQLPVEKGYVINDDQFIIKNIINELMCNNFLDLSAFAKAHNMSTENLRAISGFRDEKLKDFIQDGLVEYQKEQITLTEKGKLFVRNIAACFDPTYTAQKNKYSKSV